MENNPITSSPTITTTPSPAMDLGTSPKNSTNNHSSAAHKNIKRKPKVSGKPNPNFLSSSTVTPPTAIRKKKIPPIDDPVATLRRHLDLNNNKQSQRGRAQDIIWESESNEKNNNNETLNFLPLSQGGSKPDIGNLPKGKNRLSVDNSRSNTPLLTPDEAKPKRRRVASEPPISSWDFHRRIKTVKAESESDSENEGSYIAPLPKLEIKEVPTVVRHMGSVRQLVFHRGSGSEAEDFVRPTNLQLNPALLNRSKRVSTEVENIHRIEDGLSYLINFSEKTIIGGTLSGLLANFIRTSSDLKFQAEFILTLHFWCNKVELLDLMTDCLKEKSISKLIKKEPLYESPITMNSKLPLIIDKSNDPEDETDNFFYDSLSFRRDVKSPPQVPQQLLENLSHDREAIKRVTSDLRGKIRARKKAGLPNTPTIPETKRSSDTTDYMHKGFVFSPRTSSSPSSENDIISPRRQIHSEAYNSDSFLTSTDEAPSYTAKPVPPPLIPSLSMPVENNRKSEESISPKPPNRPPPPIPSADSSSELPSPLNLKNTPSAAVAAAATGKRSTLLDSPQTARVLGTKESPTKAPERPYHHPTKSELEKASSPTGNHSLIKNPKYPVEKEGRRIGRGPLKKSKSTGQVKPFIRKRAVVDPNKVSDESTNEEDKGKPEGKKKTPGRKDKTKKTKEKLLLDPNNSSNYSTYYNRPEPAINQIRSVVEESAIIKGKVLFTILMDEERKSNLYFPTTKVNEILSNLCRIRNYNMSDYEVKNISGKLLSISDETTIADLGNEDIIRFDIKESIRLENIAHSQPDHKEKFKKLTAKAQGLTLDDVTVINLSQDQQNLISLLHDWMHLNIYDFINEPMKSKLEKFKSNLEGDSYENLNRTWRYKIEGIREDNWPLLVGEIVVSDPNKYYKKYVEGSVILDWFNNHKPKLRTTDVITICKDLLASELLKKEGKDEEKKFVTFHKYRFIIPHANYLEAKVRNLDITPLKTIETDFSDFPANVFAKQLTYFEWILFKRIELREILFYLKGDKDKREKYAPNLLNAINFFNRVSHWVITEILTCPNLKQRQSLLKKYINIAKHCFEYKNYTGLLEIVLGLHHMSITRMKLTWKIPREYITLFDTMYKIVSPENNWEHWRKLLKESIETAYIPYIGLILSDLTFIKDGGGDVLPEVPPQYGIHHGWAKNRSISNLLLNFLLLQEKSLEKEISPDLEYQKYISKLFALDETEFFKKSKSLEPSQQ